MLTILTGLFPIHVNPTISNVAHLSASFLRPGLEMLSPSLPGLTEPALMALIGVALIFIAVLLRRRSLGSSVS